jgi:uncharacterized SAM-dependent methyltransferase
VYDPGPGRIEMYLVSRQRQVARVGGQAFEFDAGERICTEHSYKYTVDGFSQLARAAGFRPVRHWTDDQALFAVLYLQAEPT